jgi:hypothetical protein
LALFVVVLPKQDLEAGGQTLLGTVGGGHKGVEVGQAQKQAQGPETCDAVLLKDEVEGLYESFEESQSVRGLKEGGQCRRSAGALLALLPITEGGMRDTGASGVGPRRSGGLRGLLTVMEVACGIGAGIAKRGFRSGGRRSMLSSGHGSAPGVAVW